LIGPSLAPLVVVGRKPFEDGAGVVRGAAADDPGSERASVLSTRAPVMGRGHYPRVDHLGGPLGRAVRPVVGPGFEQADAAVGVLGEPRGEGTSCRSATHDDDVGSHGAEHKEVGTLIPVEMLDVFSPRTREWFERAFASP